MGASLAKQNRFVRLLYIRRATIVYLFIYILDPIYTGYVTTVQALYILEIGCLSWVFIILNVEI